MKANKDKCHLNVNNNGHVLTKLDDVEIENINYEKLLGIKIDSKFNFKEHRDGIVEKTGRKINILFRIAPYMNVARRKLLMDPFFASQFNYYPLVRMYHQYQQQVIL